MVVSQSYTLMTEVRFFHGARATFLIIFKALERQSRSLKINYPVSRAESSKLGEILQFINRYQSGLMAQSAKLLIREFESHPVV